MACLVEKSPCPTCTEKVVKHARMMEKNIDKFGIHFESFQDALEEGEAEILLTKHENQRSLFRAFSRANILEVIQNGWAVEAYQDNPFTYCFLIMYHLQVAPKTYRPVHAVCILDSRTNKLIVKTVYDPRSHAWKWTENYDERVCFCQKEDSHD